MGIAPDWTAPSGTTDTLPFRGKSLNNSVDKFVGEPFEGFTKLVVVDTMIA